MMIKDKYIVLKFGGSLLYSPHDFEQVQCEIKRYLVQGYRVVAVVSAFNGVTENLLIKARNQSLAEESADYAECVAGGEFTSGAELVLHLKENGIDACLRAPAELLFLARGQRAAAVPIGVDASRLMDALSQNSVVIVPGFSAIDEKGDCILLGRGGSDISAICMAGALALDRVRLLKDVDGLYDVDPNKFVNAQRLDVVDYKTAEKIGGELVQPEAIRFAASRNIIIDIAGMGKPYETRIGTAVCQARLSTFQCNAS